MTDDVREEAGDIPPALARDEWFSRSARIGAPDFDASVMIGRDGLTLEEHADDSQVWINDVGGLAKLIALANAALPDEDPRKFTWETVARLREAADALDVEGADMKNPEPESIETLRDLADVLEAYLPPRT